MGLLRSVSLGLLVFAAFNQPVLAKSVALVIGNSAYEHVHGLTNPNADSATVAKNLQGAGFDLVELRKDLTATDMRRVLREFADKVRDADVAAIYFAGHGLEIDGTNYLVPVDAILAKDIDAFDEAIPLDRLLTVIEPAKKLRLIILDACRDNPFAKSMKRTVGSRAISRGLAKVEPNSPNTLIAYAAKAGSTASDGDGPNSPFTTALVKYITKPGLDIRKAFGFVRDDVLKDTRNRQEPFVYGSLGGEDVSLVAARNLSLPQGLDQATDARRDYELALQVGTKNGWTSFLNAYQTGLYADLAREQLERLNANQKELQKPAEQKIVALPPEKSPFSSKELARLIQFELHRVGCRSGEIGSDWGLAARKSVQLFNKHAGTNLDVKSASLETLTSIKERPAGTCPLSCDHGYKAAGEVCVKFTCGAGMLLNSDNECVKKSEGPAAVRRDRTPVLRKQAQFDNPKPETSGQIICNQQGCRPVKKGCHVERSRKTWTTGEYQFCD